MNRRLDTAPLESANPIQRCVQPLTAGSYGSLRFRITTNRNNCDVQWLDNAPFRMESQQNTHCRGEPQLELRDEEKLWSLWMAVSTLGWSRIFFLKSNFSIYQKWKKKKEGNFFVIQIQWIEPYGTTDRLIKHMGLEQHLFKFRKQFHASTNHKYWMILSTNIWYGKAFHAKKVFRRHMASFELP